jgi:hypothetical protein
VGEEENCRDREESLEFAVLDAAIDVERARSSIFCMRMKRLGGRQ